MKEVLRLDHGVLTHFPAPAGRNKPALILCPGGGYEYCLTSVLPVKHLLYI